MVAPRSFCELPRETVRKGVRVTSEASILVVSSNKIELLLDSFRLVLRLQAGAIRTFRTVSEGVFSETGLQAYEVPGSSSARASFLLRKGRLDSIGLHRLSLLGDY